MGRKGYSFTGFSNVNSITLPASVGKIGKSTFMDTGYYLNSDNWKDGMLYAGNHLLAVDATAVGEVVFIKDNTLSVAEDAFANCDSVKYLIVPSSLVSVYSTGFNGLSNLEAFLYRGVKSAWDALISSNTKAFSSFTETTVYFYSKNAPTAFGYYWHQLSVAPFYEIWEYTAESATEIIGGNYNAMNPTKVDVVTVTTDGGNVIRLEEEYLFGTVVIEGFQGGNALDAAIYSYVETNLGATNSGIKEYIDKKGLRTDGGKWIVSGKKIACPKNINFDYSLFSECSFVDGVLSFTVAAENTASVFGEDCAFNTDVEVTVVVVDNKIASISVVTDNYESNSQYSYDLVDIEIEV